MKTYSFQEAGEFLGVAPNTVRNLVKDGKLIVDVEVRNGRKVTVVMEDELLAVKEERRKEQASKLGINLDAIDDADLDAEEPSEVIPQGFIWLTNEMDAREKRIRELEELLRDAARENGQLKGENTELRSALERSFAETLEWRKEARDARGRTVWDWFKKREA